MENYLKSVISKIKNRRERINGKNNIIDVCRYGGMTKIQNKYIREFIIKHNINNIGQTGFNSGLSAYYFLSTGAFVTSFDIGERINIIKAAEKTINDMFPDKHKLIIGNSVETVENYNSENKFDLAFVDGGHQDDIPYLDAINFMKHMDKGSFILFDDFNNRIKNSSVVNSVKRLINEKKLEIYEGPIYDTGSDNYKIKPIDYIEQNYKRGFIMLRII